MRADAGKIGSRFYFFSFFTFHRDENDELYVKSKIEIS